MRSMNTKAIYFALVSIAIFSMPGSIDAQNPSKGRAKLIEDAKREGKVVVYVSSNASDAKALKATFEGKYPFVQMEFLARGRMRC